MRIDGAWRVCDDTAIRPVIRAQARRSDGTWIPVLFLVDCGADRTVFSANVLRDLAVPFAPATDKLEGVGGKADSVILDTSLRMMRENHSPVSFDGQFAAFTEPAALDMSVLGRDLTNLFAVIVDRPQDVVCLVGGNHRYLIVDK
jgi:hypothetical protein